jgi:hypothetical protein
MRWAKTLQILMVAICGLGVGTYLGDFSGRATAWAALICFSLALVAGLYQLISDVWRA